jgi:hypothetical protein
MDGAILIPVNRLIRDDDEGGGNQITGQEVQET